MVISCTRKFWFTPSCTRKCTSSNTTCALVSVNSTCQFDSYTLPDFSGVYQHCICDDIFVILSRIISTRSSNCFHNFWPSKKEVKCKRNLWFTSSYLRVAGTVALLVKLAVFSSTSPQPVVSVKLWSVVSGCSNSAQSLSCRVWELTTRREEPRAEQIGLISKVNWRNKKSCAQ